MDVTKHNFQSVLEELDSELVTAAFLAIDTEFTGLQDGSLTSRVLPLDTPAERYKKVRQTASQFLVIQFGLTIFKHDKDGGKYLYKTYNFYIFPNSSTSLPGHPNVKFLSQASSITFLASHGFDFNKLFLNGIPYLNMSQEEKIRKILEERFSVEATSNDSFRVVAIDNNPPEIPEEHKTWMDSIMLRIERHLNSEECGDTDELVIENMNAFQRKLIFSHGQKKYPSAHFESRNGDYNNKDMVISKTAPASKEELAEKARLATWEEFEKAIGFSQVLKKITKSGKLVIGHNALLDLVHIINQFSAELPEDYDEFKELSRAVFPHFLDTKVMASSSPLREQLPNSALEPLLQTVMKEPFKLGEIAAMNEESSYDIGQKKVHEAGYDSFITGICFIGMSNYLMELGKVSNPGANLADSPLIAPFTQKIFMMMSNDIPYLTLDGPDLDPPRDHIFHLTFPKTWKLQDIFQLFRTYGPVHVSWKGETSAFITLHRKEMKDMILTNITPPLGVTLASYQSYMNSQVSLLSVTPVQNEEVANGKASKKRSKSCDPEESYAAKRTRQSCESAKVPYVPQFEVSNDWD